MNMMKITVKRILGIIGLLMAIGFGVFVYGGWQMFGDELKAIKSLKMIKDEKIIGCYQDVRDHVVFTNKRVIAVNVQGITGKKKDFTTLPYSKITAEPLQTLYESHIVLWNVC